MDRLVGIATKIERAEKHILDFQAEWRAFGNRAYEITPYEENQMRHYRLSVKHAIPASLSAIIGDTVYNLRSALDYLIHQLLAAKNIESGRHHYFPISESAEKFKSSYLGKIKGVGEEAERLIKDLKPYKDGTSGFWELDELSRIDKHRLLITVAIQPGAIGFFRTGGIFPFSPEFEHARQELIANLRNEFIRKGAECPALEDGQILSRVPIGSKLYQDAQIGIEIAFSQNEILKCQPVLPKLRQLANLVKRSIEPFRPLLVERV